MRLRSYYAIAGSSFLLLSISCLSQSPKPEDPPDRLVEAVADAKADKKADAKTDEKADAKADEGDSGEGVGTDDGGGPPPDAAGTKLSDGCDREEMPFEGVCTPKDQVQKVLDIRKDVALEKYQKAERPQQAAQAGHELLEQQIAQGDKMEDDLDEIIEVLRDEKRKKDGPKKGDF